ncbi:glycosyltransferase family 2 protein [Candidatus Pelagibacter sp.]|jgi:glycosyltransferase involved in cell wall biosynthesis|nr:glycosyltransferase family 2 protein [Candidatus Pelagibacter sp.]|tara:strand:+ start:423 stop:1085 length:663 start_codon:yes stop_codon:yes gene_type:complete
MESLTLVIPAKREEGSLPLVLNEIKDFNCSVIVILEESDLLTIEAIKGFNCKIIFQKGRGYGNAIIEGINAVKTEYLCIFNADGSFDPKYLNEMLELCKDRDYVFASRYLKGAGSDDDTIVTKIGNFIFSALGNILFSLKLSDILYTYILGKKESFQSLNLKSNDFCLCVEIPVKMKRMNAMYIETPSFERIRIHGIKKVKAFQDGFKILTHMIKLFLKI